MKYFGIVTKGKLKLKDQTRFNNTLQSFEGKEVVIKIREKEDGRSIEQNALWWRWMTIIGSSIGHTKEEMHTILKYKFLQRTKIVDGKEIITLKSTATLSKDEFNQLINDVFFWANDTLNIRLPNE
jgi:hypothetical protein|tara:strand:+ start:158 stop:535 length:378 start_codon:yes stop_codon:yes gene_type:complete